MDNQIEIIKQNGGDFVSQQAEGYQVSGNEILPEIKFASLKKVYENSFIVGGIIKKISNGIDTGFEKTDNEDLNDFLKKLDVDFIAKNLYVYGNCFLEKVRNMAETEFVGVKKFITTEVRKKEGEAGGYIQQVNGDKQEFAEDEVIHISNGSITDKNYGDTEFKTAMVQLILLHYIDKYYNNYFERGTFGSKVLTDANQSLSKKQRKALKEFIKEELNGMSNSSATAIIPADLDTIDLNNELDTGSFLTYRKELIKSIAISLDIPIDMLLSEDSNRSTSEQASKDFYKSVIISLQKTIEEQLQEKLSDMFEYADQIKFIRTDTADKEKQANYLGKLVDKGIMTPNEAREKLGLEPKEGGDKLDSRSGMQRDLDEVEKRTGNIYDRIQNKGE